MKDSDIDDYKAMNRGFSRQRVQWLTGVGRDDELSTHTKFFVFITTILVSLTVLAVAVE